ncbi:MAG TPA: hypothetical protein VH437_13500 [Terriglobales bacterium]|jgi:hypothetical protein
MTRSTGRIAGILLSLTLLLLCARPASAIPAFARKYGLPCSACHEAWPKLSNFGQVFRDNGYQLGNDRDSPIYQNPSYWPIMFRTSTQWHRETFDRFPLDSIPGNPNSPTVESNITTSGFDLTGIDMFAAGTLYKNISFGIQPFIDNTGRIHLETAFVRFDNLLGSPWINLKFGKFELDNLISERRILTLDNNGFYQLYHFKPAGDNNIFGGLGSNQLGVELLGHSRNSYTRYSVSLLSSTNGAVNLPTSHTYDVYADFTQGFEIPGLGLQRVGVYGYFGKSPTYFQTSGGNAIPGTGSGNRSYYRTGVYGLWYIGKFDFSTFYMHGQENVFLGNGVRADQPFNLPLGAAGPSWNGGFVEAHYTYNPRLILISKYELIRMSRQANPSRADNFGNLDTWTIGYRWYPFMSTRAGLAWLQEYSRTQTAGTAPLSGLSSTSSSYLMGFDFDF